MKETHQSGPNKKAAAKGMAETNGGITVARKRGGVSSGRRQS